MKKRLNLITTILLSGSLLFLSSCLKDSSYVNFSKAGNIVEFPLGGTPFFSSDAVTASGDTIVIQFAVNLSSVSVPTTATTVGVGVDNSIVTSYDAANSSVDYLPMPTGSYVFNTTSVTVPANQRSAILTVTFYKGLLDPAKSYMLPIKITGAPGYTISGSQGVTYFHFIGNDFAGAYAQNFERWNAPDSTSAALNGNSFFDQPVTFFPLSPTEFTVKSGYAGSLVSYDVTFTKNTDGTYTNFAVQILPSDISVLTNDGITLVQNAVFDPALPATQPNYTFAEALKLFRFQWIAATSSDRYLVDYYSKR